MQTIALILNQLPWLVAAIALLVIRRAIGNGAATIQPTVIALNMISSPPCVRAHARRTCAARSLSVVARALNVALRACESP